VKRLALLLAIASVALLAGCATQSSDYAGGGGVGFFDCDFGDCDPYGYGPAGVTIYRLPPSTPAQPQRNGIARVNPRPAPRPVPRGSSAPVQGARAGSSAPRSSSSARLSMPSTAMHAASSSVHVSSGSHR
jgi:hypothetical protein